VRGGAKLVALALVSSSLASAAEEARVALLLPACELPGVAVTDLRRAVALDLRAEGLLLAPAGELSPGRDVELLIEATCPAPDELTLSAQHEKERRARPFRLSELPSEQRPRALSLALSELVSLVWNPQPQPAVPEAPPPAAPERSAPEPPATEPPAPPTPTPAPPPLVPEITLQDDVAPVPARRLRVGLSPQARLFDGTWLWGGELWLAHSRLRYGAGLLLARSTSVSGTVTTRLVHATAGYAVPLLESAGGSVLESGPRLGFGHTFMVVQPSGGAVGRDAHDWYLDGAWGARYAGRVSKTLTLGFGVELGYARGPIGYADDLVVARTSGPFASLTVDGGLSP
jgi:hypothetical protein